MTYTSTRLSGVVFKHRTTLQLSLVLSTVHSYEVMEDHTLVQTSPDLVRIPAKASWLT
jgi:hypothetical protein